VESGVTALKETTFDFNAATYLGGAARDRISFDEREYQVESNF
jgi:hypothetical protein